MTVSPDLSDRMASPKDPLRRSANSDGKRRNRQVRVQLSVYGTPRLTPNKVGAGWRYSDQKLQAYGLSHLAHFLANKLALYILAAIRPHSRARSRDNSPITRRRRRRMAFSSTLGLPREFGRGTESHAGAREDEHGDAPQGQAGKVVLHRSTKKIVNIAIPNPL